MARVLLLGCGDIGRRIGIIHRDLGDPVIAVARSTANLNEAETLGFTTLRCDFEQPGSPLPQADLVYYCAAPEPAADHADPADPADRRLLGALGQLPRPSAGLLYISTSGVYGDCQGRWVDECETLKPRTPRGRRRLAAELTLRAWSAASGSRCITLRVPGIYGPGRLPAARLRAGAPVLCESDSPFTNRVHADDLAAAAKLALEHGIAQAAYNVSDGQPTTMTDYFNRCADLLELPRPPQITMAQARRQLSPALLSFFDESKRLSTRRLRQLGFTPRYASLAEGLAACRPS